MPHTLVGKTEKSVARYDYVIKEQYVQRFQTRPKLGRPLQIRFPRLG